MEHFLRFPLLCENDIRSQLEDYNDKDHPFYGYIGNDNAIEMALDITFKAFNTRILEKDGSSFCPRICNSRIALVAPASAGKTDYAKRFSKLLEIPFVIIDGSTLSSIADLLKSCFNQWTQNEHVKNAKLKVWGKKENKVVLPPICLFIDEIHRTSGKIQDQMLKMLESNDGVLVTQDGIFYDFSNVCIIVATNDAGKLREAFKTRFTFVNLNKPNKANVAKIIKVNFPNFSEEQCRKISFLSMTIRQALDFAKLVEMSIKRSNKPIDESIDSVRKRMGIYLNGLSTRAVTVLESLSSCKEDGCSKKTLLASVPDMDEKEFEEIIIPQLISFDKPHLISIENKHKITENGKKMLAECLAENLNYY